MPRVAGRPALVLVSVAAFASGAAMLAACSSFGATESAPDASSETSLPADAALADGSSGDGVACPPLSFCDSFDDGAPLPRGWAGPKGVSYGNLSLVDTAGFNGTGGLRGIVANGTPQASYLAHDVAMAGPPAYDVVIGFRALVDLSVDGVVLGPRFTVTGAAGDRNLSVAFKKGSVRLDPNMCDAGDCVLATNETKVGPGWHRYDLTLSVRPQGASPGSTVELRVDGVSAINLPLPLALSNPSSYGFLFGVTYASGAAGGQLFFDDASFLLTQR